MADKRNHEARDSTRAGSEAAEGIHGSQNVRDDEDRSGSEPLTHREAEHKSGYGGEKAQPKTSSEDR